MSDRRSRFLIVKLGSLGDIIHAIPAAAALRRRYPQARIDWLVDPRYRTVLELVGGLDHRIPVDTRGGLRALGQVVRALRKTTYDAVVDLQGLFKSAVLARAAGARRTIGLPRQHLREPLARFFYDTQPDPGHDPHVIHKSLMLMRALGVDDLQVTFPLNVPHTKAAEAVAASFGPEGFLLLNPGAAWPNKRWPPERFGALAARLRTEAGRRSLVLWGPGEEAFASSVVDASQGAAALSPPTSIVDLFAIAQRASLMVSGDTGPLHIAAAVGTPIVALFGPTRSERNGPWAPADVTISRTAQCACLYARRCTSPTRCLDDIGLDEVVSAVRRRIA